MAHQKIVKEINNKLSELTEQFKKISVSDEIHLIEVDILMGMLRELYTKTNLLKEPEHEEEVAVSPAAYDSHIPAEQSHTPEKIVETSPPLTPHIPEEVASFEAQPEIEPTEIQAPPDYIFNLPIVPELKPEDEATLPEITTPAVEIAQPEKIEPIQPPVTPVQSYLTPKPPVHQAELFGNGSLSDKYKTEAPSINDRKIEGKSDHTLADKINLTPINDIKSAIGINEKFQFINELFEGSAQLYNEAIALLNNCTGAETARTLFHDYQIRNNWDTENKAFLQFKEYIERRYLHS